jgi:methionyl aminopeptidase
MSITKKTPEEIEILAAGGRILARMLCELGEKCIPGVTTEDLNDEAMVMVEKSGVEPVLLGYHPPFADRPYPAAICTSVNDVVQHGVPSATVVLEAGDIINLDMTIGYKGLVLDSGITVPVGEVDAQSKRLIDVTKEALAIGLKAAVPGNHIGDIGHSIQTFVESNGFSAVEALCGHGVGYDVHEEPQIPNYGKPGKGALIEVGHVYAIEPIVNIGKKDVRFDIDGDGYSVFTKDGSRSAHFEHTVAITKSGARILTKE